jgi:hypothetical protein
VIASSVPGTGLPARLIDVSLPPRRRWSDAPRSHVVDVRPSPPRIYDWATEPEVDDCPPHGIERVTS